MGNQKLKWTSDEETALLAGVEKHGPGKWKNILKDPQFAPFLTNRSNIDLKDKWRNLSVSAGQGSREKSRAKNNQVNAEYSTPDSLIHQIVHSDAAVDDDSSNGAQDGTNAARYNSMIFEALSTMNDENGSDIGAIVNFVEQRHEPPLPPNFRRVLGTRLRRLVLQGKIEKVQNGYKLKKGTSSGTPTTTPAPMPKDVVITPQQSQNSASVTSAQTQAADAAAQKIADAAAQKIADAENKSYLAAKAVELSEEISRQAEDSEAMLQLANEIYAQCCQDEAILLA